MFTKYLCHFSNLHLLCMCCFGGLVSDPFQFWFFLFTERVVFKKQDICVTTRLTINGYLFISPREHLDALVSIYIY